MKKKTIITNQKVHYGYQPKYREGKHEYERHSGTGRGKEIAKSGAGSRYTWGTNNQYAQSEANKYNADEEDVYADEDEDLFNYAVTDKPAEKEVVKDSYNNYNYKDNYYNTNYYNKGGDYYNRNYENKNYENKNYDNNNKNYYNKNYENKGYDNKYYEDSNVNKEEELPKEAETVKKEGDQNKENINSGNNAKNEYDNQNQDWEKKKKKKGFADEKREGDEVLVRPENSLSYNEYMEQMKKKKEMLNAPIAQSNQGKSNLKAATVQVPEVQKK